MSCAADFPKKKAATIDEDLAQMTNPQLLEEAMRLRAEIRRHRGERGHERCWLDDSRLYETLPEGCPAGMPLPPQKLFLANCARYWRDRQSPATTVAVDHHLPHRIEGYTLGVAMPHEIEQLEAFDCKIWGEASNTRYLYRQLIDLNPDLVLVMRSSSGEIAGFTVGLLGASRAEGWVLSIDVNPEHRGKGIGRALLDGLIASFDRLVVNQITAIIAHSNAASRDLFQSASFELKGEEEGYFGAGDLQQRWVLRLSNPEMPC